MSTIEQRRAEAETWNAEQSAAFIRAPEAWITREHLTGTAAAARLEISPIRLGQWLNGALRPKPEEVVRVLERAK